MDIQSSLKLVKPRGHPVTKKHLKWFEKVFSFICLMCYLPKYFQFCSCTPMLQPTQGSIWQQSLPEALLPPLLIPTSAPWHSPAVPAALQTKAEKNPSLKSITCGSGSGGRWRNTGEKLCRIIFLLFFYYYF